MSCVILTRYDAYKPANLDHKNRAVVTCIHNVLSTIFIIFTVLKIAFYCIGVFYILKKWITKRLRLNSKKKSYVISYTNNVFDNLAVCQLNVSRIR